MATLAVMLTDPRALQRLDAAVDGEHVVRHCASWEALEAACQDDTISLAILDLFTEGKAHFDVIRRLKLRAERLTLVAYVTVGPERARDLFDAGRAGLDGLLIAGQDDTPAAFRAVLERAEARGAAQLLRPRIAHLTGTVRDAVMVSVTRAHLRLTAQRLCEILGVSKRALLKALEDSGCPAPAKLITWGRLIVAAQMLEDGQRTADGVARLLDFPSGSAFRNTTQRYLGATPQEIRDKGGANWVANRFIAELGQ
ncbi:MAG: helix-turn-helix domain-containing protein [Gemmatimonadaceae bacterium]|nr:helix-turn-helix domain-containing protein [Gemmatimonadaceae bacterium]